MVLPTPRPTTAIVVLVKDGMPLLGEILSAAAFQGADELLVIDSGSTDDSVAAARASGFSVLEIPPESFGHGRTRNLAVERTTADVIAFLTQDATPVAGWLEGLVDAFAVDERIGVVFGPHLPRRDTSPMIARELLDYFGPFSPDGRVRVQRRHDEPGWHPAFLSNVNAAYRREAIEAVRFRDIGYAEDQAFARDAFHAGWWKAYQPRAAVLHAHDYPWTAFMRRYFDEYRGLRETTGYRMTFFPQGIARDAVVEARADATWLAQRGVGRGTRRRWLLRSLRHHAGRRIAGVAGGRAPQLPAFLRGALSLERRDGTESAVEGPTEPPPGPADIASAAVETRRIEPGPFTTPFAVVSEVETLGAIPLDPEWSVPPDQEVLDIAVVVPGFRPGSGGHSTIFTLVEQLERWGHRVSIWLHDPHGMHLRQSATEVADDIRRHFRHLGAPVHVGFGEWGGAHVTLATGWDTVYAALRLPRSGARAYLVQDHEPEFFATSAERLWAERTYTYGLHPICASRWLADLIARHHGGPATAFELGVEHDVYRRCDEIPRRGDTVALYSRAATPRRAGPIAELALVELLSRADDIRVVTFGSPQPLSLPFAHQHAGVLAPRDLARLYSESTVGVSLSLTNYSLVPQEMLACGLPCVDLAGFSSEVAYGEPCPIDLVPPTVPDLADTIERLIRDEDHWRKRSEDGLRYAADRTWTGAARSVEEGLRIAIAEARGDAPRRS